MNQPQYETKEEINDKVSNHQPDTLERLLEQWMGEAEKEPTDRTWTEKTTKGKTNN